LRAIYRCLNSRLVRAEVCEENDKYNWCVRNSRRKGKRFYPFNNGAKVVCAKKKDVEKTSGVGASKSVFSIFDKLIGS
jgi:hypothetical protein